MAFINLCVAVLLRKVAKNRQTLQYKISKIFSNIFNFALYDNDNDDDDKSCGDDKDNDENYDRIITLHATHPFLPCSILSCLIYLLLPLIF